MRNPQRGLHQEHRFHKVQRATLELALLIRKEGRKYIIGEIYNPPRVIPLSPNDKYSEDILNCIAYRLNLLDEESHLFSNIELLKCCGFVNRNWASHTLIEQYAASKGYSIKEAEYHFGVLEDHVRSYGRKDHIDKSLKILSEKGFVNYADVLLIQFQAPNNYREATDEEAELYRTIKEEFIKSNEIAYIGRPYYKSFDDKLKEKMDIKGLSGVRTAHRISLAKGCPISNDSESLFNSAADSFLSINNRCLEYVSKKAEKDVVRSAFNYIHYVHGYDCPAVLLAPKKGNSERIMDRQYLAKQFIETTYDDIFGQGRDEYIWGDEPK